MINQAASLQKETASLERYVTEQSFSNDIWSARGGLGHLKAYSLGCIKHAVVEVWALRHLLKDL
ncbi:11388_t:CDS:2 [Cetraspora pellucida]|uniref:11388_t:CDS:1 n=1 Tax=Cetraspora pellucida TaxID=1433469 RepID=A0ACA9LC65_9GLOM|nr:11388_t:CDS:2 [Cetraspora pellucida]